MCLYIYICVYVCMYVCVYVYIHMQGGRGCVCVCVYWLIACFQNWFRLQQDRKCGAAKSASAGNRTRVTSMATMYSTTRPLMLLKYLFGWLISWLVSGWLVGWLVPGSHTKLRVFWQQAAAVACTHIYVYIYIYIYIHVYSYVYICTGWTAVRKKAELCK